MTDNINDRNEMEFASVEDPLNIYIAASNEATLVSEIANVINEQNFIITTGQGKIPVSILSNGFCEKQLFFIFFLGVHLAITFLEVFH